ncbi:hypothetical protein T4D_14108 [Trichinella pseudospiralis]|nr:hypothetical protein T4D_14108 [Trichinella pseudospiralis]
MGIDNDEFHFVSYKTNISCLGTMPPNLEMKFFHICTLHSVLYCPSLPMSVYRIAGTFCAKQSVDQHRL